MSLLLLTDNIMYDSYQCVCVPGTTNGRCSYDFRGFYSYVCGDDSSCATCTVLEGGNCDLDFDECASEPCENGGRCVQSNYTSSIEKYGIEIYGSYSCVCADGYAGGLCEYDFIVEYDADCAIDLDGNCDVDVDECSSNPCKNGATCSDSTSNPEVPAHAYRCTCVAGFANGLCEYEFIPEYTAECTVPHSAVSQTGNCDLDVNECASNPCANGATCTESGSLNLTTWSNDTMTWDDVYGDGSFSEASWSEDTVSFDAYSCSCAPGYSNGVCLYDYIDLVSSECGVWEGGNCNHDVDECSSGPCMNGATCIDSLSSDAQFAVGAHAYLCACTAGFASGLCDRSDLTDPSLVAVYGAMCTLSYALSEQANCDVDIDECISNPCLNEGVCTDSSISPLVSYDAFSCACAPGWEGGVCHPTHPDLASIHCAVEGGRCGMDVDECQSNPCRNGAACLDSTDFCDVCDARLGASEVPADEFVCKCLAGYSDGVCFDEALASFPALREECTLVSGKCDRDMDECASVPCNNGAECQDSSGDAEIPIDRYSCTCAVGFAGGFCAEDHIHPPEYDMECVGRWGENCNVDVDECISDPCFYGAECMDSGSAVGVSPDRFSCSCRPGYANGTCPYDYVRTSQYELLCNVAEGGRCDHVVNECASIPCENGGECHASPAYAHLPPDYYTCVCMAGFSGMNCHVDINECQIQERSSSGGFNPCQNGGFCAESGDPPRSLATYDGCDFIRVDIAGNATVDPNQWCCACLPGWAGGTCAEDVDECLSEPCQHGAACTESTTVGSNFTEIDAYVCACTEGWAGKTCSENIDECQSSPCRNGGICYDVIAAFECSCTHGWEGDKCHLPVDLCRDEQNDCNINADCIFTGPAEYTCECREGFRGSGEFCREYTDPIPIIIGSSVAVFAALVCACLMSYRKEQKAYHALLAMEGHHVHQHSRGGVSDKISTWVRHNVTHRHKLPPTDDGGARVEDAFDALGDGIKHYDDIKVLADRIKRHRSADDMKLLQKLVGTDAQLRSRAIQNHAIDNLITVILRSKAVEPRQVAKETIAALLPGKVSDIAQYVTFLNADTFGVPSFAAAMLRKFCEDSSTGARSCSVIVSKDVLSNLILMLKRRDEEGEAARLMAILVAKDEGTKAAALRDGAVKPLLHLWHRRQRHPDHRYIGRVLHELTSLDDGLKDQMTPAAAVKWDQDAGIPGLMESLQKTPRLQLLESLEDTFLSGDRERGLGIKHTCAEPLFSLLIDSQIPEIKVGASSALAVLLPGNVDDAKHHVDLLKSKVNGLPSYSAALIARLCEDKRDGERNRNLLVEAGAIVGLAESLRVKGEESECVKTLELLIRGKDKCEKLALQAGATQPLVSLVEERGKVDAAGAAAYRILLSLAKIDDKVTASLDKISSADDVDEALQELQDDSSSSDEDDEAANRMNELLGDKDSEKAKELKQVIKRLKDSPDAADAKVLQTVVAADEELRKLALKKGATEALFLMLLRPKSADDKAVAQSALGALLPGKISDTAHHVKLLQSSVAGLPSYSATMLRKLCEDSKTGATTLANRKEWIVDAGAVPKLVRMLSVRGEETEAARALAVIVVGVNDIRRLALKAGATEPLLKLRSRGQHDAAGAAATRVLEELSTIDNAIVRNLDDTVRKTMQMDMVEKHLARRQQRRPQDAKRRTGDIRADIEPQTYRAMKKAPISELFDRKSAKIGDIQVGTMIQAQETRVNEYGQTRVRFKGGWLSVQSQTGAILLEPRDSASLNDAASDSSFSSESPSDYSSTESDSSESDVDKPSANAAEESSASSSSESDSSEDEQPQRFKKPDPVAELEALGLSRTQAERALLAAGGNVERAKEALLDMGSGSSESESESESESDSSESDEAPEPAKDPIAAAAPESSSSEEEEQKEEEEPKLQKDDVAALPTHQLRKELRDRGLRATGLRREMVKRLEQALDPVYQANVTELMAEGTITRLEAETVLDASGGSLDAARAALKQPSSSSEDSDSESDDEEPAPRRAIAAAPAAKKVNKVLPLATVEKMDRVALRAECKARGLPVTGLRKELLERLEPWIDPDAEEEEDDEPASSGLVAEMRPLGFSATQVQIALDEVGGDERAARMLLTGESESSSSGSSSDSDVDV